MPDNKDKPFKTLSQELEEARFKKMHERKEAADEINRRAEEVRKAQENPQPESEQIVDKEKQEPTNEMDQIFFEIEKELYDLDRKRKEIDKKRKDELIAEYKAHEEKKTKRKQEIKAREDRERLKELEEKEKEKRKHEEPEVDQPLSDTLIQTQETFLDKTLEITGELLHTELGVLSIVISTLMIPLHTWRLFRDFYDRRHDEATLAMRALMFAGGVTLAALTIVVVIGVVYIAAPILVMVGAAKGFAESTWELGKSIYDRFAGIGKKEQKLIDESKKEIKDDLRNDLNAKPKPAAISQLTASINVQRLRNQAVVNRTHSLIIAGTAIVGAALLFTPAAPIGLGILAGVTLYSVGFAVANIISKKIRGKPILNFFPPKTEAQVVKDLKREVIKEKGLEKVEEKKIQIETLPTPKSQQEAQMVRTPAPQQAKLHESTTDILDILDIFEKAPSIAAQSTVKKVSNEPLETKSEQPETKSEQPQVKATPPFNTPSPASKEKQAHEDKEGEGEGEGERRNNGNTYHR